MHYKNGREAKVGDRIVVPNSGKPYIGFLSEAVATSNTCNGRVIPLPVNNETYVTLSDVLHVEDGLVK
jgi:hypothetical protein